MAGIKKKEMIEKDLGFVLRRFNFRETSVIATIFTKKFGKINGILKGFYTLKKEFTTSLELFSLNEFIFYPTRGELWLISFADLVQDYSFLRDSLEKNCVASSFCKIVNKVIPLQEKSEKVFELIRLSFTYLKDFSPQKVFYIFLVKLLSLCGFKPEFSQCLICGGKIGKSNKVFFNVASGGLLCERCYRLKPGSQEISKQAFLSILFFQNHSFSSSLKLECSPWEEEILYVIKSFVSYHLTLPSFLLREVKIDS